MDCVEKHKDDMLDCLNRSVPSIFQDDITNNNRNHAHLFLNRRYLTQLDQDSF